MNNEPFEARDGYTRGKNLRMLRVRFMTKQEALNPPVHVKILCDGGTVRDAKVNGMTKTWKRDADRIRVPLKYGMYECFYDDGQRGTDLMEYMLVECD